MYIIEVIPLAILPPQVPQLLSYFFNKPLIRGSIVEVLIGNRKTPAAVVSSVSMEEQKASLKKSSFQLKKISGILSESALVSDIQFKTALWLSRNYFAPLGSCLRTVLPPFFLKKNYELITVNHEQKISTPVILGVPTILLTRAKNIIKDIEPEIKKVLKQKKQVLFIAPEVSVAEYLYDYFAGYYEAGLVHSKIPVKKYYQNYKKISAGDSEVIIGTRQALFAPFKDLGLIIIEDPSNAAYKSDMSPKYNTADLAKKVSEIYSCPIIYVSQIPSAEEYFMLENDKYKKTNNQTTSTAEIKITDMIQEIKSGNFSTFGREFKELLTKYIDDKKNILIFSSRKGYSGAFVCENCGFSPKCPNCSIPFKYHKSPQILLICNRCSTAQKPPESCPNCHSYKLKATGFSGSQKLEEEVKRILGDKVPIFILDTGLVKTPKAEKELLEKMEGSSPSVCIATQMIFSHRYTRKFDLIVVQNIDSLSTMPDFQSEEELFGQFQKLLDFEPEKILVQKYHTDESLLRLLIGGDYRTFYEKEFQLRKIFWYPPFVRLVKLSFKSPDAQKASYEARVLNEKLKMALIQRKYDNVVKVVGPSPAFVEKEKNLYIYNIILKIKPELRPDDILRFVPSHWLIDVDPKSIL